MTQKTVLSNGAKIVSEKLPYAQSVAMGIWVRNGSRNEKEEEHGVSHFLEHLHFKGTQKRSAKMISEEIENIGGQMNAFTTKEYTCFFVRVLNDYFSLAVDILCDMLFNSQYSSKDIEKEKGIIIEEIKSLEDTPDEIVHDYFEKCLWGEHPLGRSILGTVDSVLGISRDKVLSFLERQYTGKNYVIACTGNIDHETVVSTVGKSFERLPEGEKNYSSSPEKRQPEILINERSNEQVQICLGTQAVSLMDDNLYTLAVLNYIMGGGLSSKLFQEIREELGLAYSIYSYDLSFIDTGLWCIHAGTSCENMKSVLSSCLHIMGNVKNNLPASSELDRAKQQLKGEILLSMESTVNRMIRIGRSELTYDKVIEVDELLQKIMNVSKEDVHLLAQKLFSDDLGLAIVGPCQDTIDLQQMSLEAGLS